MLYGISQMDLFNIDNLYGEQILEHSRNPRNNFILDVFDAQADAINPFCGDEVSIQLKLGASHIKNLGVQTIGCSINIASASMMSVTIVGKTLPEIREIQKQFYRFMAGEELPDKQIKLLGNLINLAPVLEFPIRIKCALLPWTALDDALSK